MNGSQMCYEERGCLCSFYFISKGCSKDNSNYSLTSDAEEDIVTTTEISLYFQVLGERTSRIKFIRNNLKYLPLFQ